MAVWKKFRYASSLRPGDSFKQLGSDGPFELIHDIRYINSPNGLDPWRTIVILLNRDNKFVEVTFDSHAERTVVEVDTLSRV